MKKLTKRERILLICLVLFLVGVLYYRLFYVPMQQEIATLNIQLKTKDTVDGLGNNISNLNNIKGETSKLEEKLNTVYENVPDIKEKPNLYKYLSDMILNRSFRQQMLIGDTDTFLDISILPITFVLDTNYDNLVDILKQLEGCAYSNDILQLNVIKNIMDTGAEDTNTSIIDKEDGILSVNINMVFYLRDSEIDNIEFDFMDIEFGRDNPFKSID